LAASTSHCIIDSSIDSQYYDSCFHVVVVVYIGCSYIVNPVFATTVKITEEGKKQSTSTDAPSKQLE
jgi:hypothetical protein